MDSGQEVRAEVIRDIGKELLKAEGLIKVVRAVLMRQIEQEKINE
jgi:hypothetical protein